MPRTLPGELAAHEEIGDDVDIGAERQVLVDRLDARRLGLGRRGEVARRAPSKTHPPGGRPRPPAMILTSVDLPAPLSPRSATTSPRSTMKLTPRSASIAPKLLGDAVEFEERLRIGHVAMRSGRFEQRVERMRGRGAGRRTSCAEARRQHARDGERGRPAEHRILRRPATASAAGAVRSRRAAIEFGSGVGRRRTSRCRSASARARRARSSRGRRGSRW